MTVVNDLEPKSKNGAFVPLFRRQEEGRQGSNNSVSVYRGVSGLHHCSTYLPDPMDLWLQVCNCEVN